MSTASEPTPIERRHRFEVTVEAIAEDEDVEEFLSALLAENFGGVSNVKLLPLEDSTDSMLKAQVKNLLENPYLDLVTLVMNLKEIFDL